ncbi:MAG: DNA mismatch repair endonuclease MutL [Candidatus Eremiobacteraeota bacterium]|nr:DNA mismatch repair endonuclease MutL [Candidatus Eremiobacteraeota bacterium]MBV8354060.1 DNA mismatch repair endonuclease MutL [Candidatus Eremiobacteraeota bacterium]
MIRLLDAETIGRIAAGEVIERPLSVVKELVENALDADATRIAVDVRSGGLDEIAVADNGAGIPPSELPLAVRRHATSKLSDAADLERIGTLGFRGEGLASIAAVARLEITSRTAHEDIGARILAHGESIGDVAPAAAPPGTRVVARDLFANVPVRREFLRSASAEFARISTWLGTLALGYPAVTFRLTHDGRALWTLPAGNVVGSRLSHVFGPRAANGLVPVPPLPAAHHIGVSGFVSTPGNDRPDRRMQLLFVNGRLLRTTLLAGAWASGYVGFTMSGRHPYGVLFVTLPPDHVDPNVHPTKSDVRLRYDRAVFETVRASIAATLKGDARARLETAISFAPPNGRGATAGAAPQAALFDQRGELNGAGHGLRVLAQLDDTYIVATDDTALVLIDQHAAHERIAYETISARADQNAGSSEPLLVPLVVELDGARAEALEGAAEALREAGLEVEAFGERAYRISATPAGYQARGFDLAGFLADADADVGGPSRLSAREHIWASLACHSVVRAGERLSLGELATLVERLQTCANPMHCPHGRPTIVRFEAGEIARLFKRQ